MKRSLSGLIITLTLLLSMFIFAETADANFIGALQGLPTITIQADGSVVPQTEYIKQEGNIYKLTADLQQTYVIVINCSNIVFDGQGHVINGTQPDETVRKLGAIGYYSSAITLEGISNVIVKDISIMGFTKYETVYINNCSKLSIIGMHASLIVIENSNYNTLSHSAITLNVKNSKYNTIIKNNITLGLDTISVHNLVFENNIGSLDYGVHYVREAGYCPLTAWDNGSVGNYWSDYSDKYPDALEIDDTGIADKPYVVDGDNIDHYPLMRPVSIQQEQEPSVQGTKENESFPMIPLFAVVFIVAIAGAIMGLVIKKRSYRGKADE
jgi:nitrous oxidase accessory protein NosD